MIEFGNKEEQATIDEHGSTKTVITTWRAGVPSNKIKYAIRVKVRNEKEELAETIRFRREHPYKKGVEIRIESSNTASKDGSYYLVKCWEE